MFGVLFGYNPIILASLPGVLIVYWLKEQVMGIELEITSEVVLVQFPVTVFHLRGWLDAQSENQLVGAAQKVYDQGGRFILLGMREIDMLTSAGIRGIQKVFQIFTPQEAVYKVAHLKLANAPPQIYHILSITGFLHNVPMYESVQNALFSMEA